MPEGADYAQHITASTPGFENLTTSLLCVHGHGLRTPNEAFFLSKSQSFELGQSIWAVRFWGIWGISGRFIRNRFDTVSPLSMFSINQPLFLQKTKLLYISKLQTFILDLDLNLGRKELGI